jgi:hypothetical protein
LGEAVFSLAWFFFLIYRNSGQGCGNVGIAERFPRAVGRVENLILVFHAFHRPVIPTAWLRLIRFCSLLLLLRGSAEAIRFFPAARLMERRLYGYDLHDLRPVDAMKKIPPRPVLLVYGLLELPVDSDRRPQLKAALPDAELWVVPDAIHTGAYTKVPQPYLAKVGAFFERNLK